VLDKVGGPPLRKVLRYDLKLAGDSGFPSQGSFPAIDPI
jgi:hypothetical protein